MAAAISAEAHADTITSGIRPVDPIRDMPAIVDLIELGFGEELDPQGQKMLAQMRQVARQGAWAQVMTGMAMETTGFVWVDGQQVLGNLSLRRAFPGSARGMLIGNVVVHSDYRGRGIGRALMEAAIKAAREQGMRWVGLEVRADNPVACELYRRLGFEAVGRTPHLVRPEGLPWPDYAAPRLQWRPSRQKDSLAWDRLARAVYGRRQQWVLEVRPGMYASGGFERWFNLWISGQRESAWLQEDEEVRLAVRMKTDRRYHFHLWDLLVHPDVEDSLAQEVVAKALDVMRRSRPWPVVILVADQPAVLEALYGAGLVLHRDLIQMVLGL